MIQRDIGLNKSNYDTIRNVVLKAKAQFDKNLPFDESTCTYERISQRIIKPNLLKMHMFVTYHKKGIGLHTLKNTLNVMHFEPNNLPLIGYTAVRNCVQREANRVLN